MSRRGRDDPEPTEAQRECWQQERLIAVRIAWRARLLRERKEQTEQTEQTEREIGGTNGKY